MYTAALTLHQVQSDLIQSDLAMQAESNLTEVVMRLGMGWPMTLLDVTFRK
jgi:hypothetical protein